jgi:exodeoxyribonuclease III
VSFTIATWNINSVRARVDRLLAWVAQHRPDVLCLQELKCTDDQFPTLELSALGYRVELFGQKTYNGVALVTRLPCTEVARNLGDDDEQHRLIAGRVGAVDVVCLYAPNGQSPDSPAYAYKLTWYERLERWLKARRSPNDLVAVCGDFNVAPAEIDVWSVPLFAGQTLFTAKEQAALFKMRDALGLRDVFREKNPGPGLFSWWDYRMNAFKKNQGLRIDHLWCTEPLAQRCVASEVDTAAREGKLPSDHAPVWARFELP